MNTVSLFGVAEVHRFERYRGLGVEGLNGVCFFHDGRLRIQNSIDPLCGRQADHALVEHRAQIAHRPKDFNAHHQNNQQCSKFHLFRRYPVGPQTQRERGTHGDRRISDAAGQRISG